MDLRCQDVRNDALPLSDERAELIARHIDGCEACEREFRARIASVVDALPSAGAPSMAEVRRRIRDERSSVFRWFAAAAAGVLIVVTGWAVLRSEKPSQVTAKPVIDEIIPDPPALDTLPPMDRQFIKSEGVVSLYLQFMLSCLNTPTEDDKREFLIRALLVLREARHSIKARYDKGGQALEVVTRDVLDEALQTMRSSPLASVKLLPTKINTFKVVPPDQWTVEHMLASKQWRLTLHQQPLYLHFAYLKKALNADDALMNRIEDALWFDLYVNLPKRIEDKDPQIPSKALETVIPLLSARQQKIFRKIVGVP